MKTDAELAHASAELEASVDDLTLKIDARMEERAELLFALKSLVRYLRAQERWPIKPDHMAYLEQAENALRRADGRPSPGLKTEEKEET